MPEKQSPPVLKAVDSKSPKLHRRLYALQGLRAYAAGMVIFVHAISTYESKIGVLYGLPAFAGLGEMGVKLFFCISGFIIFNSAKDMAAGLKSLFAFCRRRLIRVVPIYWLATCIYAGKLALQGTAPSLTELGMSLFFIPYTIDFGLMRPVLGVGWSLNFEMFFYLLFGISLLFAKQFRALFLFVTLGTLLASRAGGWLVQGLGYFLDCMYLLADFYLLYFLAGLLVGLLRERLVASNRTVTLSFTSALIASSGVLLLYLALHIQGVIPSGMIEATMAIICILCVGICVLEFRTFDHSGDGILARSMGLAGDASYSTYLTHGFVMGPVARVISLTGINVSPLLFSALMVPVCTYVGILIYRWVERPLTQSLNARFA